jgi:aconitate hydratase
MIRLTAHPVYLDGRGNILPEEGKDTYAGRAGTMAYRILKAHNHSGDMEHLNIRFDAMVSPDNNYVSILQSARAAGLEAFLLPYVLSNCHNTLCAVGGTTSEDDHAFGLSAVKRYGGIFLPPYRGVLHQYMRERMAGGGKMILGSDSHTRYGALGTMGIGEGGGELVKQLLGHTYDMSCPPVIAVKLTGAPKPGVGPMDAALAMAAETFPIGFNKNKILEFVGEGIGNLSMEYRMGIDVMTTETAALSSIWCTDEKTRAYLRDHGREEDYVQLSPENGALYDGLIEIDLSLVEPMIALPFHPSNALPIRVFKEDMERYLSQVEEAGRKIKGNRGKPFSIMHHLREGGFYPDQALVSGCAGGMTENITAIADILKGADLKAEGLSLHVNPSSLPVMEDLIRSGTASELAMAGVTLRPAICGPCFGVTDAPANDQLSIRHVTRNYPGREGSSPGQGQMAAVCLMDARSIAATVRNGGSLTAATELDVEYRDFSPSYERGIYERQVLDRYGWPDPKEKLVMGPGIADWPRMASMKKNLLLVTAGSYQGSVTTDELIPSGEASSYRSNPEKISGFTLISRDPAYVTRAKKVREEAAEINFSKEGDITLGTLLAGDQIGDGSSREQAASCQKVLGGFANLAGEYSTKRYRSNCINWGLVPLRTEERVEIPLGSYIYIEDMAGILERGEEKVTALLLDGQGRDVRALMDVLEKEGPEALTVRKIPCTLDSLTKDERTILRAGCLINYYREGH